MEYQDNAINQQPRPSVPTPPKPTEFASSIAFVRGTDNRIYLNRLRGFLWSGWSEVPGGGLTPSGPAATSYRSHIYLFVRGTDNAIYVNRF